MIRVNYLHKPQGCTWTKTIKEPERNHFVCKEEQQCVLCRSCTAFVARRTDAEGEQSCGQGKHKPLKIKELFEINTHTHTLGICIQSYR